MSNPNKLRPREAGSAERPLADALFESLSAVWSSRAAASRPRETNALPIPHDDDARYRALVDQIPAVIFMAYLDREAASKAYVSPHIETALGFSQDEWLDDPVLWYYRIHPGDRDRWSAEAADTLISGKPLKSVYRVIARGGRTIWLQCEVKTVCRDSGEPWFIHGVAFDISELKEAEEKLQRAHNELEQRVRERTAALQREVELRKRGEIALSENLGQLRSLYETANAASRASSVDEVFGVALQALKTALKADRGSVLLFDADGVMRFKASVGLSTAYRNAVEGHSPWNRDTENPEPIVFSDAENEPSLSDFRSTILNEGIRALAFIPLLGEARLIGKLMAYFDAPHEFTENEVRIAQTVASHIGFAIEKKLAEEQRAELLVREQAAREQAEHANRLKDQFIATASHELRTPLAAILGWTHLLQSGGLDAAKREKAVKVIDRNARAQARIVDEILDVSRITSGRIQLHLQLADFAAIIESTVEAVRPEAETKGVTLDCELELNPGTVRGDPDRLQQVVGNILSNAIKFTDQGGRIAVSLRTSNHTAEMLVRDTGKGINPEFIPHIFEPFRQADASASRKQGGLGLGLAIVRQLIELHGGTVRAESAGEGQGSTFAVELPLVPAAETREAGIENGYQEQPAARSGQPADAEGPLQGVRVLVVEDEPDSREFVELALTEQGAQVSVASSAREALAALGKMKPDVLCSDIGLPGEDGWSLIQKIRSQEAGLREENTPAIALTGYATSADRERVLGAGYDAYLKKPVDASTLVRTIADVIRGRREHENSPGILPRN